MKVLISRESSDPSLLTSSKIIVHNTSVLWLSDGWRGWSVSLAVDPLLRSQLKRVNNFTLYWHEILPTDLQCSQTLSTSVALIAMKYVKHIHVPLMLIRNNFGNTFSFSSSALKGMYN